MIDVPFHKPDISEADIAAVVQCLRSGWLTSGPVTHEFETRFAESVQAPHAIALNSCTAALHLALESLQLKAGECVLVPAMTFAATAEVVRYFGAHPIFVDSDPQTLCMAPQALAQTLERLRAGQAVQGVTRGAVKAVIVVHYGGQIADVEAMAEICAAFDVALIEDAAHALPAAWRERSGTWLSVGQAPRIACFSFYANKCVTTGEGGMLTTHDPKIAERVRLMSLHGLSKDAWRRFARGGSWNYDIVQPGFKYNMTDVAAALGLSQLGRAQEMQRQREAIAARYQAAFAQCEALVTPTCREDRKHAWHLYPLRLQPAHLTLSRDEFIQQLQARAIQTSVHYKPLHLHPYYQETYPFDENDLTVATKEWQKMLSLPLYPGLTSAQQEWVITSVLEIIKQHRRT